MVGIKDFEMPKCCMNCEMFDGEYGNCDIIGDTQDFEYQWNENRPFDCPLVEAIPKADYEARLKADMVAMLEEIQLEIEEIEIDEPFGFEPISKTSAFYEGVSASSKVIQEAIDKLKGE